MKASIKNSNALSQAHLHNNFAQAINNAIWPSTDVDRFLSLLEQAGNDFLNVRHGSRHDTCLHRSGTYLFYIYIFALIVLYQHLATVLVSLHRFSDDNYNNIRR